MPHAASSLTALRRPESDPRPRLCIGHSPDPDDAFMWWPLTAGQSGATPMDTGRFRFEPVLADIETLNRNAARGELEITALSCAAYPLVRDRYVLTACGASLGDGFGPRIVAPRPMTIDELRSREIVLAVPGRRTSAFAAASLLLGPSAFRFEEVAFDRIIDEVAAGRFAAGLVIHEGQLTFEQRGLHLVADLGAWWFGRTGLPLPLGVNAIRRDLDDLHGPGTLRDVAATLARSVRFALDHREQALRHALQFGRGLDPSLADRFVNMYVNRWTLDFGPTGRQAVARFLHELAHAGLVPALESDLEFVGGDSTFQS